MSDVYDLRALPLFAECDDPELDLVARLLTPIDASPGRILMVQDGLARQFVIVESGEVEVVHHQPDGTDHVVTLGPDSWVGEVGLINHVPCTAAVSTRHGARVHVAGVDDPHFFQTDDLERALAGRPDGAFSLLLSHSSLLHPRAEAAGVRLMLSGHTHGGQFCLPGGLSLLNNTRSPRRLLKGAWRHGNLHGYTSRGIGCTGLPLRFNCPPELVVHILEPA